MGEIVTTTSDLTLVLSPDRVLTSVLVSPHHKTFGLLRHWVGKPVDQLLTVESRPKLAARLASLGPGVAGSVQVELNHVDSVQWEFPIRYTLHKLGEGGSVLMLGRDMRPIGEMQQRLVSAQLALERDHEVQRELDTRYRVMMEVTRDAVVLVAMNSGRIDDVSAAAALMLGGARQDLVGSALAQEFEGRRRGELLETLTNLAATDSATPIELQARRSQRRLMIYPTLFRASGERLLLCRMEAAGETLPVADELSENLARLFHEGVDAVVFADVEGMVRHANEAFLNLTDSTSLVAVRGRSLVEFLARGNVDLKVLIDNSRRAGHMRMYATKLVTAFAGQVSVEISATYLNHRSGATLGLVLRDASRADTLRRSGLARAEDGSRSLVELVGSSTLKDIVAETTDVVERMCIETAVELTRNNRVAAAEMLGLSRQSLYVKLRKYGLLNRDGD